MEIGNKAAGNNDHKAVDRNVSARSRFSSENTTTTMTGLSEYELPLDPAWEFPRDDLMIGPGGVRQSNFKTFYSGNIRPNWTSLQGHYVRYQRIHARCACSLMNDTVVYSFSEKARRFQDVPKRRIFIHLTAPEMHYVIRGYKRVGVSLVAQLFIQFSKGMIL